MTTAHSNICEIDTSRPLFSAEELSLIDPQLCPKHVAIIMDGNRRWAKQKGLAPIMGHWEGAEALVEVVQAAHLLGVKTITVYSFSTENWDRANEEVAALMDLFEIYLLDKAEWMCKEGVRLDAIGDLSRLPLRVQEALASTKAKTSGGNNINLVLAMNYGGRDEIRRAVQKMVQTKPLLTEITEEDIAKHLDTHPWGDPEILIRTSGELRVSNFLLWQISYAEFYITDVLWPDFSAHNLYDAVLSFQQRQRRKGM
jgi:undecaprenyl diphosphate synthase